MVLYPDVQLRARDLIDNVCKGRLPDFSDFDSLPYIHAIVKECLRWHPVLSLGKVNMNSLLHILTVLM